MNPLFMVGKLSPREGHDLPVMIQEISGRAGTDTQISLFLR